MHYRPLVLFMAVGLGPIGMARAQASYRNLDAGFPVRVEDATVTERYALDLDFLNFRYDDLSDSRNRFQYEPQVSYGMLPRAEVWVRLPSYYRESTFTPRSGIAGLGVGAMYQFTVETLHVPALALATELFQPVGRDALPSRFARRHHLRSLGPALRRPVPRAAVARCPHSTDPARLGRTQRLPRRS